MELKLKRNTLKTAAGTKKLSKKKKLFMAFLVLIVAAASFALYITLTATTETLGKVDANIKITDMREKPESGLPTDFSAAENFYIAAGVIYNADYFSATTDGLVTAMGGAYRQTVTGLRTKHLDKMFHESVSAGALTVAEQKFYYLTDNLVLKADGKKSGGGYTYGDVYQMNLDDYTAAYGLLPREICKYAVTSGGNEEFTDTTVLDGGYIGQTDEGFYQFYLNLKPESAKYYRYEMRTLAGTKNPPEFKSIKLTYTIDSEWVPKKITVDESYDIALFGGLNCKGSLSETFDMVVETFGDNKSEYSFNSDADKFLDFEITGEITPPKPQEVSPVTYLTDAFEPILSGSPIALKANIDAMSIPLDFSLLINIDPLSVKIKIADNFYAGIDGNKIFISANDKKIYFTTDSIADTAKKLNIDVNEVLKSIGIDSDMLSGFDISAAADLLPVLLANISMRDTENYVNIALPFNMFDINFNVDIGIKKSGDTYSPDRITADIDLANINAISELGLKSSKVCADLVFDDNPVYPNIDNSFVCYDFLLDYVTAATDFIDAKTYNFNADIGINIYNQNGNFDTFNIGIKNFTLARQGNNKIALKAVVNMFETDFEIAFLDDTIYLKTGNIMLKENLNNLPELITKIAAIFAPDFDISSISFSDVNTSMIVDTWLKFVPELSLDGIIGLLSGVNGDASKLSIDITPSASAPYNIEISKTNGCVTGLKIGEIRLDNLGINLSVNSIVLSPNTSDIIVSNPTAYSSISDVAAYLDSVMFLTKLKSFDIDLNGSISIAAIDGYLDNNNIALSANVSLPTDSESGKINPQIKLDFLSGSNELFGHKTALYYIENDLYLNLNNNIKLKFGKDSISDILGDTFGNMLGGITAPIKTSGFDLFNFDARQYIDILQHFNANTECLSIGINIKGITAVINVYPLTNGELKLDLDFNYVDESNTVVSASFGGIKIYNASENAVTILPPSDDIEYVDFETLKAFINPVTNTISQDFFAIEFGGSVNSENGTDTYFSGNIDIYPLTDITNISFPEFDLSLKIGNGLTNDGAVDAQHNLHLVMKNLNSGSQSGGDDDDNADPLMQIYLDYNGLKIKISYDTALKLLGGLCDILKFDIPFVKSLTDGVYTGLDTAIFEGMDITGFNDIKDAINNFFNAVDGIGGEDSKSQFEALLDDILKNSINGILRTTKLANCDDGIKITLANSLFNDGNDGEAEIIISHNGDILSGLNINNLIANGNTVNVTAKLNCDKKEIANPETSGEFNGSFDLNTLYTFIENLVDTANIREFDIEGIVNASALGIFSADISIKLQVKIVGEGENQKVYVALKLHSDGFLAVLDSFTSYLYFDGEYLYLDKDGDSGDKFVKIENWKRKYRKYSEAYRYKQTPEQFLDDIIENILFLIPFKSYIANEIRASGNSDSGSDTPALKIEKFLKNYSYSDNSYNLSLAMGELTSMMGDVNIKLNTKPITTDKGTTDMMQSFRLDTEMFSLIKLGFDAKLKNLENGSVSDMTSFQSGYTGIHTAEVFYIDDLKNTLSKMDFGDDSNNAKNPKKAVYETYYLK